MDPYMQLNYLYPGTSNVARLHFSQGSLHHVSMPSIQHQVYQGDTWARSDLNGKAHACSSSDLIASHDSLPPRKSTLGGPQVTAHPDSKQTMKMCYTDGPANLSDQYVPSSSDKITCTDHRPLDEIFGDIHYPSESSQVMSGSLHLSQNGTPRGHPRYTSVLTYTLPTKPQLDGVIQIPLLAVDNQMSGTGLVVDFRCSDWGIGVQVEGIPMTDLLYGNVSGLESPYQRVFDGLGITNLRFNIFWPHYPPFVKMISAFGTDGKLMTRAELGYEVSLAFAEFFYQITIHSIPPAQPGPYTISPSPTGSSAHGIEFEQLHLITVRNTSCGEWMAEIRAVSIP